MAKRCHFQSEENLSFLSRVKNYHASYDGTYWEACMNVKVFTYRDLGISCKLFKLSSGLTAVFISFFLVACGFTDDSLPGGLESEADKRQPTLNQWHATVLIENGTGHGTGVVIGNSAVLTANHVVDDGVVEVEFFGREQAPGNVMWFDVELDLAILRVDVPKQYRAPELYCGNLDTSELLVVVGHPLTERWVSVQGHLGASDLLKDSLLLPLDFELNLGNSGGPVFDRSGRVVGIATAILVNVPIQTIPSASILKGVDRESGIGLMLPSNQFCEQVLPIH